MNFIVWRQWNAFEQKWQRDKISRSEKKKWNKNIYSVKHTHTHTQYLRDPERQKEEKTSGRQAGRLADLQSCGSFMGAWTKEKYKLFHLKSHKNVCIFDINDCVCAFSAWISSSIFFVSLYFVQPLAIAGNLLRSLQRASITESDTRWYTNRRTKCHHSCL